MEQWYQTKVHNLKEDRYKLLDELKQVKMILRNPYLATKYRKAKFWEFDQHHYK